MCEQEYIPYALPKAFFTSIINLMDDKSNEL